jgi:hypothetical protein
LTSDIMVRSARLLNRDGAIFALGGDRRAQLCVDFDACLALASGLTQDKLRYTLDSKDVTDADYAFETLCAFLKKRACEDDRYRTRPFVVAAYDTRSRPAFGRA